MARPPRVRHRAAPKSHPSGATAGRGHRWCAPQTPVRRPVCGLSVQTMSSTPHTRPTGTRPYESAPGGHGADRIIDVGGPATLSKPLRAARPAGQIQLVGSLTNAAVVGEWIGGSIALGIAARRNPPVAQVIVISPYDCGRWAAYAAALRSPLQEFFLSSVFGQHKCKLLLAQAAACPQSSAPWLGAEPGGRQ